MVPQFSRRSFLKTASAVTAATCAARVVPAWAVTDRGTVAVESPLTTFAYSDIELLDSPLQRQFDQNHARFLNLDDDRRSTRSRGRHGRLVRSDRLQPRTQRF